MISKSRRKKLNSTNGRAGTIPITGHASRAISMTPTRNPGNYLISARDATGYVNTQTRTIRADSHGHGARIGRARYTSRSSTVRGVADRFKVLGPVPTIEGKKEREQTMDTIALGAAIGTIAAAIYAGVAANEQRRTRMDDKFPCMVVRSRDVGPIDHKYAKIVATQQLRLVNVGRGPAFITKFRIRNVTGHKDGDHTIHIDRVIGPEVGDPALQCHFAWGTPQDIREDSNKPDKVSIGICYEDTGGRIFRSGIIRGTPVWDPPPEFRLSWFAIQRQRICRKEIEVSDLVKELRAFLAE